MSIVEDIQGLPDLILANDGNEQGKELADADGNVYSRRNAKRIVWIVEIDNVHCQEGQRQGLDKHDQKGTGDRRLGASILVVRSRQVVGRGKEAVRVMGKDAYIARGGGPGAFGLMEQCNSFAQTLQLCILFL